MEDLLVTPPPTPPESTSTDGIASSRSSKSAKVAQEIVETEKSYVESLDGIAKGYKTQVIDYIRFCGLPLAVEDAITLFGNIDDVLEFSRIFLSELESCKFDPEKIAQTFVDNANGFYTYTVYCTNYPKAVAVLSSCQDKPEITEFFKACQKKVKHSLPLGAFLIKPVQRILKYHLFLRDLVSSIQKETRKSMSIVEVALATMSDIAAHINEMKRQHEAAIHIQEVQAQLLGWDNDDLSLCGKLLLEDSFRVRGAKNERIVYLFDRLLLIVRRKGEHLVYKGSIPCNKLTLTDLVIGEPLDFKVSELDNLSNAFTFRTNNMTEKSRWTKVIKELMVSFHAQPESDRSSLRRRTATRKRRKSGSPSQISSVTVKLTSKTDENEEKEPVFTSSSPTVISVAKSRESTPSQSKKTKITIVSAEEEITMNAPPEKKVEIKEKTPSDDEDEEEEYSGSHFQLKLNVGTAVAVENRAKGNDDVDAGFKEEVAMKIDEEMSENPLQSVEESEKEKGDFLEEESTEKIVEESEKKGSETKEVIPEEKVDLVEEKTSLSTPVLASENQPQIEDETEEENADFVKEETSLSTPVLTSQNEPQIEEESTEKKADFVEEQISRATPVLANQNEDEYLKEMPPLLDHNYAASDDSTSQKFAQSYADAARAPPAEEPKKQAVIQAKSLGEKSPPRPKKEKAKKTPDPAPPSTTTKEGNEDENDREDAWVQSSKRSRGNRGGQAKQKPKPKSSNEQQKEKQSPKIKRQEVKMKKETEEETEAKAKKAEEPSQKVVFRKRATKKESQTTTTKSDEEDVESVASSPCPCCPSLHIVLVSIALIIALLFALVSQYPLHIKVGLVSLPSAALLLFLCAGERRAGPRVIS
ncbi:pleckstrin homology domain-containing family G member 3-like [Oscarella lobularis]|uniref:pleckstrin homology domain-containing family G member 3-like n=1 Tax=Oscarella lobularis TaxID=121494 RepID=UPI003313B956